MRKVILLLLFHLLFVSALTAQTADLTLGSVFSVCAGQEVVIPLSAKNLNNAGAISLKLGFDTTNLTFLSLTNINSQLTGLLFNFIPEPSQVIISWSSVVPATIEDGKLFDLKFKFSGKTGQVVFEPGCQLTSIELLPIQTNYTNGSVVSGISENSNGNLDLRQNYPNPANGLTQFIYFLERPGQIKVQVLNILGQKLCVLADAFQEAGTHSFKLDCSGYRPGIYYYIIESSNASLQSKCVKKFVVTD